MKSLKSTSLLWRGEGGCYSGDLRTGYSKTFRFLGHNSQTMENLKIKFELVLCQLYYLSPSIFFYP